MPTYGYLCSPCGAFHVMRPMTDVTGSATCPVCGRPGRHQTVGLGADVGRPREFRRILLTDGVDAVATIWR